MKTQLSVDSPAASPSISRGWPAQPGEDLSGRTISSSDLFEGRREIGIEHHGSYYRLKITRQGKLILNK